MKNGIPNHFEFGEIPIRLRIFARLLAVFVAFFLLLATATPSQEEKPVIRLDPALDRIISLDAKLEQLPDSPGSLDLVRELIARGTG